jgi:hypothetical protein
MAPHGILFHAYNRCPVLKLVVPSSMHPWPPHHLVSGDGLELDQTCRMGKNMG